MSHGPITKQRYVAAIAQALAQGDHEYHTAKAQEWLNDAKGRFALGKMHEAIESLNVVRYEIDAAIALAHHKLAAESGPNFEGAVVWGYEQGGKV